MKAAAQMLSISKGRVETFSEGELAMVRNYWARLLPTDAAMRRLGINRKQVDDLQFFGILRPAIKASAGRRAMYVADEVECLASSLRALIRQSPLSDGQRVLEYSARTGISLGRIILAILAREITLTGWSAEDATLQGMHVTAPSKIRPAHELIEIYGSDGNPGRGLRQRTGESLLTRAEVAFLETARDQNLSSEDWGLELGKRGKKLDKIRFVVPLWWTLEELLNESSGSYCFSYRLDSCDAEASDFCRQTKIGIRIDYEARAAIVGVKLHDIPGVSEAALLRVWPKGTSKKMPGWGKSFVEVRPFDTISSVESSSAQLLGMITEAICAVGSIPH